ILISISFLCLFSFFFSCYRAHLDLHSFPTRRSSDLVSDGAAPPPPSSPTAIVGVRGRPVPVAIACAALIACASSPASAHHEAIRSEEHTSELQSLAYLVCRLLLEKKKKKK